MLTSCSVPSSKISKTFKLDSCIHARSASEYYAPVCVGLKVVACYIRLRSLVPFFFFFISSPATFPQNEEQRMPVEDDQRLHLDTHRPTEPRRLSSLRDLAVVAPCQKFRSGNRKACCFVLLFCFCVTDLLLLPPFPRFFLRDAVLVGFSSRSSFTGHVGRGVTLFCLASLPSMLFVQVSIRFCILCACCSAFLRRHGPPDSRTAADEEAPRIVWEV